MQDHNYLLLDVHDIMQVNSNLFKKVAIYFPSISYHDILLTCAYIPTIEKEVDPTNSIYSALSGLYTFDYDKLLNNDTMILLVEQLYLGILTAVENISYQPIGNVVYNPDIHSLIGERFIAPNLMLMKIIDESCNYGLKYRRRDVPENNIRQFGSRATDSNKRS